MDNIKRNLEDIRWGGMEWVVVAQDKERWKTLVITVINCRDPYILGSY
jgi:hypothetical protein